MSDVISVFQQHAVWTWACSRAPSRIPGSTRAPATTTPVSAHPAAGKQWEDFRAYCKKKIELNLDQTKIFTKFLPLITKITFASLILTMYRIFKNFHKAFYGSYFTKFSHMRFTISKVFKAAITCQQINCFINVTP